MRSHHTSLRLFLAALFLALLAAAPQVCAQTVIDLHGGGIRAKNMDDYRNESKVRKRLAADSLLYVDCLTRALNALQTDSFAQAEQFFKKALKTRPDAPSNFIIHQNLGKIYLSTDRFREAVEEFSRVLKEKPDDGESRYFRATCLYGVGNIRSALDDCKALLEASPAQEQKERVLFLRAAIYVNNNQLDLAKADCESILQTSPDAESVNILLAGILERLGQSQKAYQHLTDFLGRQPSSVDGHAARAELAIRLNQPREALADYDAAVRLSPNNAALYVARAKVHIALGNKLLAKKDLDSAVANGYSHGELTPLYRQVQ